MNLKIIVFGLLVAGNSFAALPQKFECYTVQADSNGKVLEKKLFESFVKTSKNSYRDVDDDGSEGEEITTLNYKYDSETRAFQLIHEIKPTRMGSVEFGLSFSSETYVYDDQQGYAVVEGRSGFDQGFYCAIPLSEFRALRGHFEVADRDLSAKHNVCRLNDLNVLKFDQPGEERLGTEV